MQNSTVGRLCITQPIDLRRTYSCPKKGNHFLTSDFSTMFMKKNILISLATIILLATNCVKPEERGGNVTPSPTSPQEQISIPATVDLNPVVPPEGGDVKISFTATAAWTASVISTTAGSWVDVNPKSGNQGSAEIRISTAKNGTYVKRNATIQIKCGDNAKEIFLTQKQDVDFIASIQNPGIYVINESSVEPLLVHSPDNHSQIGFVHNASVNTFRIQRWGADALCVQICYPEEISVGEDASINIKILGSLSGIQSGGYKTTAEKIENGAIWLLGDKFCFIVKE